MLRNFTKFRFRLIKLFSCRRFFTIFWHSNRRLFFTFHGFSLTFVFCLFPVHVPSNFQISLLPLSCPKIVREIWYRWITKLSTFLGQAGHTFVLLASLSQISMAFFVLKRLKKNSSGRIFARQTMKIAALNKTFNRNKWEQAIRDEKTVEIHLRLQLGNEKCSIDW
jgi:hypothetical protein